MGIIIPMNFRPELDQFEELLKQKVHQYFPLDNRLNEAIHYSLFGGGKRIRPLLCLGFSGALKGNQDMAFICGIAVEMIHTYSLIHDDLPAMDNDDFRRGKPTNHKMFGEALAILAGDSLLNTAPEFLIKELASLQTSTEKILKLTTLLLKASGPQGMILGQSMDILYESKDLSTLDRLTLEKDLKKIHDLKTGKLIAWSCLAGLYSHDDPHFIQGHYDQIKGIGEDIGLLFQMVDDVLDVTSNLSELGKTPGKDEKVGKLTYITLYGLEKTHAEALNLAEKILSDIKEINGDWTLILDLVASLRQKLKS